MILHRQENKCQCYNKPFRHTIQEHPEKKKYQIFIFTEEITIHHTPNPFSDDEGNKNPKTMDDTDPTPDAQNRRGKESRSSNTSDEQSGEEDLKRKKRRTKKVQISILISIRKLLKEHTESPTITPTLNVIHVEDKLDFHIDTNFYKDLIEQARKTLQKGDICKQLDQENRPYSLEVPECTYQVSKFKYDKIPMPINAYFRQTCKDPHYDSTNTGTPALSLQIDSFNLHINQ